MHNIFRKYLLSGLAFQPFILSGCYSHRPRIRSAFVARQSLKNLFSKARFRGGKNASG